MRHRYLLLAFLGLGLLFSGNHISAQTWLRTVDVGGSSTGVVSMVPVADGGFAAAGSRYSQNVTEGLLVRLDSSGAVLWANRYIPSSLATTSYFSSVKATADGGFILAGQTEAYPAAPDAWLVKTDGSGAVQWQRLFGENDAGDYDKDYFLDVTATADGGYIATGGTTSFWMGSGTESGLFTAKTDASGNISWQRKTVPWGKHGEGLFIAEQADGNFMAAGTGYSTAQYIQFARYSKGSAVWPYSNPGDLLAATATSLTGYPNLFPSRAVVLADGSFVLAGQVRDPGYVAYAALFAFSASGMLSWSRVLGTSASDGVLSGLTAVPGGGVLAVGTGPAGNGGYEGWAVRLDGSGTVLWAKTYGGTDNDGLYAAVPDGSGGFLLAGSSASFPSGQYRLLFARTDGSGDIAAYCGAVRTPGDSPLSPSGSSSDELLNTSNSSTTSFNNSVTYASVSITPSVADWCPITCAAPSGTATASASDVASCPASGVLVSWPAAPADWGDGGLGTHTVTVLRDGSPVPSGGCSGAFPVGTTSCMDATGAPNTTYSYGARYTNGCGLTGDSGTVSAADLMDPLSASAGVQEESRCLGSAHSFASTASCGKPPYTFAWDFQDDGSWDSTVQSPSFTYSLPGTYAWRFQVQDVLGVTVQKTGTATASTAAPPCCVLDAFEPDDTLSQGGRGLVGGTAETRNFCDDAEDWASVAACQYRSYTFQTQNLAAGTDTVLELYGTDGTTLLASDDDGGGGLASRITWTAPADGTYHLRVRQKGGATSQTFTYDLSTAGDTTPCHAWGLRMTNAASYSEMAMKVVPLEDGSLIAAAAVSTVTTTYWWILRVSEAGTLLWQTRLTMTGSLWDAVPAGGGSVVLSGESNTGSPLWSGFLLVKIGPDGSVVWTKSYNASGYDQTPFITPGRDGGFFVVGNTTSFGGGSTEGWLLKLDVAGDPLWQRRYWIAGTKTNANGLTESPQGDLWLTGSRYLAGSQYATWVAHLDPGGAILWEQYMGLVGNTLGGGLPVLDTAGNCYLGTTASDTMTYIGDGLLAKITPSHTVEWCKRYALPSGGGRDSFQDISATASGELALCGQFGNALSLVQLDLSGTPRWARTYAPTGLSSGSWALGVTLLPDGGLALAGMDDTPAGSGYRDVVFWKLKPDGTTGAACPTIATQSLQVTTPTMTYGTNGLFTATTSVAPTSPTFTATTTTNAATTLCPWTAPPPPPAEVSPPGAAAALRFTAADTLTWEDKSLSRADTFNLYRGTLAGLPSGNYGACYQSGLTSSTATESQSPLAGECWTYLVAGKNAGGEGTLGTTSTGATRTNQTPCP